MGWDNLPIYNDTSPGAYLARIKYYRNEIAHSTENSLNTWDFQDKWKTISEVCIYVGQQYLINEQQPVQFRILKMDNISILYDADFIK